MPFSLRELGATLRDHGRGLRAIIGRGLVLKRPGDLWQDMNSMFRAPNYVSREMTPGGRVKVNGAAALEAGVIRKSRGSRNMPQRWGSWASKLQDRLHLMLMMMMMVVVVVVRSDLFSFGTSWRFVIVPEWGQVSEVDVFRWLNGSLALKPEFMSMLGHPSL